MLIFGVNLGDDIWTDDPKQLQVVRPTPSLMVRSVSVLRPPGRRRLDPVEKFLTTSYHSACYWLTDMDAAELAVQGTPAVERRTRFLRDRATPKSRTHALLVIPTRSAQRFEPLDFGFDAVGFQVEMHRFL